MGHPRAAAGLVLQVRKGLRPSELLGITPEDVLLPEERGMDAGTSHLALSLAKTNNWSPLCVLDGCGVWFYFSSDFRPGQCHGTHIKYNRMRT